MLRRLLCCLFPITFLVSAETTSISSSVETSETSETTPSTETAAILAVTITGVADEAHLNNVKAFLDIDEEQGKPIKNPSYTDYLIEQGVEQIQEALQPFGYYLTAVEVQTTKTPSQWSVNYAVKQGQPVRVTKVDVSIEGEGKKNEAFKQLVANYPLAVGDVLLQEKYTSFKNDILAQATTDGYFDGRFSRTQIILSDDLDEAEIYVTYDTGKRYVFGETRFKQDFLDEDVFQRYVTYEPGEVYSSKTLAEVQRDLYNSGYVKVIDVTANPNKPETNVPVTLAITPKKNKKHTFAIGYGTDTGVRGRYDFDWRWVNRRGHQFKSNLFISEKLMKTGAEYRIPARRPATDYYQFFINGKRDRSGDKDSTLWNLGAAYHDKIGYLDREIGIKWQQEDFTIGNDSGNIGLLTPYGQLTYRYSDNPLNTSDGLLLDGYVTGANDAVLSDVSFLQAAAQAKYINRFADKHKAKFTLAAGRTWVSDFHQLPAAYRFFTGGDRTVRGYRFEKIADRDGSGEVIGGDKMYYASAEYEYFFKENMAAAVFVDAGDAYSEESASLRVGAGVGFHYYSPIGPIKVDVAHGFHEPGDDVRLHLVIGPDL